MLPVLLLLLLLCADTLRRVYAVGQTLNDHFVAAVVVGCMGFYGLLAMGATPFALALGAFGGVGIWALFFTIHRDSAPPAWQKTLLAWPSQLAYAFALWGGLCYLIREPWALVVGAPLVGPGLYLLPAAVLAVAGFLNAWGLANKVRAHHVAGLPLKVVHLSDLHASPLMHAAELNDVVDRTNACKPDLVLITGDLLMPFSEREHGYLLDALARLQAPTFACPGNHDLPVLDTLRAGLHRVGVRMLVDEGAIIETLGHRVEVVGVQFHWKEARRHLEAALALLPPHPADFRILLAHDPRLGAWAPEGRFNLVLSGHTHGGQVAANMFGVPWSVLRLFGVRDQGWWHTGTTRHFVHAGNWLIGLPPRMGVAGEVVEMQDQSKG